MRDSIVVHVLATFLFGLSIAAAEHVGSANSTSKLGRPSAAATAARQAHLASEIAAYGRDRQDPMALIVAAEMQLLAGGHEVTLQKTSEGPDEIDGVKAESIDRYSVSSMLSDARDLARGDKYLLAAIEVVESIETKGRVGGPAFHRDRINAHTDDWYRMIFRGDEPAVISVVGDGDTDLDLRVYDQDGNLICADTNEADREICSWQPSWTGQFRVKITNLGAVWNRYILRSN